MTLPPAFVFADDEDAHVDRVVSDAQGNDLTFTPLVAVDGGAYEVAATWQGDPGPSRTLRVPVGSLLPGSHRLYLQVPGGNDLSLGSVHVMERG